MDNNKKISERISLPGHIDKDLTCGDKNKIHENIKIKLFLEPLKIIFKQR
jgi:hypothetical protein